MNEKSLDTKEDLINKFKEIAPHIFNEDKIDWEKLKSTFGDDINFSDERYVLNWAGKSDAFRAIQNQTTATLIPDKDESVNFDKTDNIFIEGENLEVLKVLQKAYYGKIKMIYIDPPYNTGNDFIYNDKFAEKKNEYLLRSGEKDEEGFLTNENLYRKNSKESGHYHSNWLTMMYPRLFLARNLLRDDGVIFVSIDDNEVHNLRMIMNEIFGEENFVALLPTIMNLKGNQDQFGFAGTHEYTIVFTKHIEKMSFGYFSILDEEITEWEIDEYGYYKKGANLKATGVNAPRSKRPNLFFPLYINGNGLVSTIRKSNDDIEVFPITNGKEMSWRWEKKKFEKEPYNTFIEKTSNGNFSVYKKQRPGLSDLPSKKPKTLFYKPEYSSGNGTQQLRELFNIDRILDNPKPLELIKDIISISSNSDSIILDFFAGSCTTAHAVLDLNKEDVSTGSAQVYGNRKFIMVQLPEKTGEKSEAYKTGFETIADIGKERIRRVIKKIEEEQKEKLNFGENKQDLGFKVFKLQESNFKIWRGDKFETGEELEEQLHAFVNPVKEDSIEENMLYELLLKSGIDLNCKIEEKDDYYLINKSELVIDLTKISEEIVKNIINAKPQKVITLDKLFDGNDQLKTNTILQMKDAGVEFKVV